MGLSPGSTERGLCSLPQPAIECKGENIYFYMALGAATHKGKAQGVQPRQVHEAEYCWGQMKAQRSCAQKERALL